VAICLRKSKYRKNAPDFNEYPSKHAPLERARFLFSRQQNGKTIGKIRQNTPQNLSTPEISRKSEVNQMRLVIFAV